ncbi:MAG: DUF2934 domain-containing protein [Brevinematales bacterium]|nr:DUF2934 domain-containing protein [Brevinematales bacterium]
MPVKKSSQTKSTTTKKATPAKKKTVKKQVEMPNLENFLAEIQKRAYDIYVERTSKNLPGDELADWLKAEKEIKDKYGIK